MKLVTLSKGEEVIENGRMVDFFFGVIYSIYIYSIYINL